MTKIIDTPIEFRCPVCGKITKVLGGEGTLGTFDSGPIIRRDNDEWCQCGRKPAKQ